MDEVGEPVPEGVVPLARHVEAVGEPITGDCGVGVRAVLEVR